MIRRLRRSDDTGATLVIVLFILTVIGVVIAAVLAQADTSVRTTEALRDEAGSAYNADGAAQVALNQLRRGGFDNAVGAQCFGASPSNNTLALPDFYPATNGQTASRPSSASVVCTAEAGTGEQGAPVPISSANKPGNAILTLGSSANGAYPAENGQTYGQSNKQIAVRGSVVSDSTINSNSAQLVVTGGATVKAVSGCFGTVTPACTSTAGISDPNYPAPADPPAPPTMPTCKPNKIAEFSPGLYTTADTFNNCKASWFLFDPGTYYFDFTSGSHVWALNNTAVGGTLTGAKSDTPPSVPGACVSPINSTSANGVELVFGGDSQLVFAKGVQAEFCATYHTNSIPTVVYGLKSNITNGTNTVHAQSGCVTTAGSAGCDLVSDGGNGTKPTFFFEGFVYLPRASITISVNNTTQPYFNFGIVARTLTFTTTGSACTPPQCSEFISLPDNSPGYGTAATIVDLDVYICSGVSTSSCSVDGSRSLQLKARVEIWTGSGTPQITVLSWSAQQ